MPESPATAPAAYRPALRPALQIERPEPAPPREGAPPAPRDPVLVDPKTGHHLPLDEVWHEAALELADGTRTADEIAAVLATREDGAPPDPLEVLYFLKTLRYLRLTEDTDPDALDRIATALADPAAYLETASWLALPGARFECQMSAACCQTLALGPLRPEDLEKLDALADLEERFPLVKELGRTQLLGEGDKAARYLPQRPDGRCGYLQDDNLCGIHAVYGPEHKPAMCHLFPTGAVATVDSVHVFDRAECKTYGTSAFGGETFGERARRHLPVLRETVEKVGVVHPRINLDGYLQLDYGYFAPFEQHLIACTTVERGTISDVLFAWREATFHLMATLSQADDASTLPEAMVEVVTRVPPGARFEGLVPRPERKPGLLALSGYLAQQHRDQSHVLAGTPALAQRAAGLEDLQLTVALCRLEAAGTAPERLSEHDPTSRRLRRVARMKLDLSDPHTNERLRRLTRELLFGMTYLAHGTWTNALSMVAAMLATMLIGARAGAERDGRSEVSDRDLDHAQARTLLLFRMPGLRAAPASLADAKAVVDDLVLPLTSPSWPLPLEA